ncbi:hypothetical protein [Kitasatospora griseola]|uniref:hypothetical protein n=1 Tax=Kitasatospora griseola TaxID=2064 RepID=UPI00381702B9
MAEPPTPPSNEPADREPQESTPPIADKRAQFTRPATGAPRDLDAERAFLENKIEVIRTHPTLSPAEKEAAVAELEAELRKLTGTEEGAD